MQSLARATVEAVMERGSIALRYHQCRLWRNWDGSKEKEGDKADVKIGRGHLEVRFNYGVRLPSEAEYRGSRFSPKPRLGWPDQ